VAEEGTARLEVAVPASPIPSRRRERRAAWRL
jgi:hypothetical protein